MFLINKYLMVFAALCLGRWSAALQLSSREAQEPAAVPPCDPAVSAVPLSVVPVLLPPGQEPIPQAAAVPAAVLPYDLAPADLAPPEDDEDDGVNFEGTINNVKMKIGGNVNIATEKEADCPGCEVANSTSVTAAPDAIMPVTGVDGDVQLRVPTSNLLKRQPTLGSLGGQVSDDERMDSLDNSQTLAIPTLAPMNLKSAMNVISDIAGSLANSSNAKNKSSLNTAVDDLAKAADAVARAARETARVSPCASGDSNSDSESESGTTTTRSPLYGPCSAAGWSPPEGTTVEPTVLPETTTPPPPADRSTCWQCPDGCVVADRCYQLQPSGESATASSCVKVKGQWCTVDDAANALFATILTSSVLAGSIAIPVADMEGLQVGDTLQIETSAGKAEAKRVLGAGADANSIEIDTPLIYNYDAGNRLEIILKAVLTTRKPEPPSTAAPPLQPARSTGSDIDLCNQCSVDFATRGGCAALSAGVMTMDYIPNGCASCGEAAIKFCNDVSSWTNGNTPSVTGAPAAADSTPPVTLTPSPLVVNNTVVVTVTAVPPAAIAPVKNTTAATPNVTVVTPPTVAPPAAVQTSVTAIPSASNETAAWFPPNASSAIHANSTNSTNSTNASASMLLALPDYSIEEIPAAAAPEDCQACASRFGANGGCKAFVDGRDFGALIPSNCGSCGHETMALCRSVANSEARLLRLH